MEGQDFFIYLLGYFVSFSNCYRGSVSEWVGKLENAQCMLGNFQSCIPDFMMSG